MNHCDLHCYKETLGLPPTATLEQIQKAYKKLRSKAHPDKHRGSVQAKERFQRIQAAYEILTGARKPAPASCTCNRPAPDGWPEPPFQGDGPQEDPAPHDGKLDKYSRIRLTLEEMFQGGVFSITDKVWGRCETCQGTGHRTNTTGCPDCQGQGMRHTPARIGVPVPARTAPGNDITIAGAGHKGNGGAKRGNLIVSVIQDTKPDRRGAALQGLDVEVPIQLDCLAAALGGPTRIDVLGVPINVSIPSRVSPGTWIAVRQEGLRSSNGRVGDLHLYISGFDVIEPLNEQTRAALRAALEEVNRRSS